MQKKVVHFVLFCFALYAVPVYGNGEVVGEYTPLKQPKKKYANVGYALSDMVSNALYDILILHKNIFTWNTLKVASTVFPLYAGARMFDERLQNWFYNSRWHKNINQMPGWCHDLSKYSIALPIFLLGSDALFSGDDEKRWTGQILLLGLPFVIWTKMWVKKIDFDASLRPWNEHFSCVKRSYGGFPSGHMAQALYMAVLYGSRYGAHYAVPLGLVAAFLSINFLTCNRHYASQLVAGGGFGTIYALAASKLVDSKMADKVQMNVTLDDHGRPAFSLAFKW